MENFWPHFWSEVASGTLIGGLVAWLISKARRPALEVSLEIATGTQGNYKLMFSIINNGRVTLRENEIYWHIYIDRVLESSVSSKNEWWVILDGKSYRYFQGTLELPCFRGSSTNCFEIPVIVKNVNVDVLELDYYYSLSTVYGFFPRPPFIKRIFRKTKVAPGGNPFVHRPIGKIKLKSI